MINMVLLNQKTNLFLAATEVKYTALCSSWHKGKTASNQSSAPRSHSDPQYPHNLQTNTLVAKGSKQSSRLNKLSQNTTYWVSNLVEDSRERVLSVVDSQEV